MAKFAGKLHAMKVLACGSRDWTDADTVNLELSRLKFGVLYDEGFTLIEGGARGADSMAGAWAEANGAEHIRVLPDWNKHGKKAGFLRNIEMLDMQPDIVIAFWDGKSRGTAHTIEQAKKRGIPVRIITPENKSLDTRIVKW